MNRKRRNRLVAGVIVIVVAAGVVLGLLLSRSGSSTANANGGPATTQVVRGDIIETLTVYGEVVAKQEYTFTFDADRLTAISVSVGQRVEADEVLVELDNTQQELALAQAERALNDARAEGAPAVVREKELAYDVARENLENATLRAPFAGVITQISRPTTSGANWSLTLIDTSELFIEAEADQLDAPDLEVGQTAMAVIEPLPDRTWPVEVVEVGGMAVSRGNSTVVVVAAKLPHADESILVGYTAEMTITISEALDVLVIPITCVREGPRGWTVTKLVDDEQVVRQVSIGTTSDAFAEVTEGLAEGDVVLLNSTTAQTSASDDTREEIWQRFQGDQGMPGGLPPGGP